MYRTMLRYVAGLLLGALVALPCLAQGKRFGEIKFRQHTIVDEQQGGIVMNTLMVPEQWKVTSKVRWNYADSSFPLRSMARIESPDGSAWVEFFPMEVFYWLEPAIGKPQAYGSRSLGMTYAPKITVQQAVQHFAIAPYRGKMPNLQVLETRAIDMRRLTDAFGMGATEPGQAIATRLRYTTMNGRVADEKLVAILGNGNRIRGPSGPLGEGFELHRPFWLVHSLGATDGNLEALMPLLTYIATSIRMDPIWLQQRAKVQAFLDEQFQRLMAQGYARIAAAGELSRRISANNDAMLAGMQAKRAADNQRDAARRAAAGANGGNNGNSAGNKTGFNDYIRGVERVNNPYGGESEVSPQKSYHWTDGNGNYRGSNDPSFNPNVGPGTGSTWQRMERRN